MTITQRYPGRYDVLGAFGSPIAIFKTQKDARAFVKAVERWVADQDKWRPVVAGRDEAHEKHDAWRPKKMRS